jgi:hypothetical protein
VHDRKVYNYSIIRVVPRVERDEFVNVGVILCCPSEDFLEARIELDETRLIAIDPNVDLESIKAHLATIPAICAGIPESAPIGELPRPRRFEWLTAPRSTVIQTSPVHTGYCQDASAVLESLLETMVRKRS